MKEVDQTKNILCLTHLFFSIISLNEMMKTLLGLMKN